MKHLKQRRALIETARRMNALGLNRGTSGNLSLRVPEGLLITPSGLAYESMEAADIVLLQADGSWQAERPGRRPSSEWRFHRDILAARPEVAAVLHCHAIFSTTLACLGLAIPPFHYMVAIAGGPDVRCAPYATFGTAELSHAALEALEGRRACLLAHHGLIACGRDLADALRVAEEVETLAEQYWRVRQLGEPKLLSAEEMERVLKKFAAGYGYASGPEEAG